MIRLWEWSAAAFILHSSLTDWLGKGKDPLAVTIMFIYFDMWYVT